MRSTAVVQRALGAIGVAGAVVKQSRHGPRQAPTAMSPFPSQPRSPVATFSVRRAFSVARLAMRGPDLYHYNVSGLSNISC
ncbi:hypothetical protein ASD37_12220 [Mycobacterium sp. Root135]|nr:hypothetical protein ASD37_12220 [Mycobacterium sp. Root135]